jgi:hypothetical protein
MGLLCFVVSSGFIGDSLFVSGEGDIGAGFEELLPELTED